MNVLLEEIIQANAEMLKLAQEYNVIASSMETDMISIFHIPATWMFNGYSYAISFIIVIYKNIHGAIIYLHWHVWFNLMMMLFLY